MGADATAWDTVVARAFATHGTRLRGLVRTITSDSELAEDIVQETFCRAIRYPQHDDPTPAWLATVARNLCIDHWRLASRREAPAGFCHDANRPLFGLPSCTPDETYEDHVRGDAIARALTLLTARQRRVLLAYAIDGCSYEELARVEGLTPDALKSLMARARRAFRAAYLVAAAGAA